MPDSLEPSPRGVIIVLGMHRSGTSLATRGLRALGVSLGNNLASESSPDNAKGHWEDRDILAFNEKLMANLALEWDVIGAADDALLSAPGLAPLLDEARALIAAKTAHGGAWAFKDPRTARLWPFWRRVFDGGDLGQPKILWLIRHPAPVARSLARRDGFVPLKSHLLWLRHNDLPLDEIAATHHVLVDYDSLLRAPLAELERIAGALGLSLADRSALAEFSDRFLDPGLRHFNVGDASFADAGLGSVAARAYETLLKVADGSTHLLDKGFRAQWRSVNAEAAAFLSAASRVDVATVSARSLTEVERRLAEEQRHQQLLHAEEVQRQVTETFHEQFTEIAGRLRDSDKRIAAAQRRQQEDLTATLREQSARTGERIERMALQQRESQEAGLTALQEQMTTTLRLQSARTGESLQQVQARVSELAAGLEQSRKDLILANELLNRERYTLFKPLLRRAYWLGVRAIERLPAPVEQRLRWFKRKLMPRSLPLTVAIGGAPAQPARRPAEQPAESEDNARALRKLERSPDCFDFLVFPVIDWHFRFQRPQQLARQLAAAGHRVFYLSTTFAAADSPGFRVLEAPANSVALVELALPGGHPNIYNDLPTDGQRELLAASVRHLVDQAQLDNLVAIVDLPFWRSLAEVVPGGLLVYDCMDFHAGFSTNSTRMIEEETRLSERADLVVTTSAGLSEIVGKTAENVLIRNAGEIDYFKQKPQRLPYASKRPVVGYLGAIADWFDIDLVVAAAAHFQDWDFVLVGSTDHCDVSAAEKLGNLKLIGEVPYSEAAGWVHSFDVAIIPFLLNELTRCTNPVKIYEYLAAGKPVVATALPEVRRIGDMAHVADDRDSFFALLEVAMAERGDGALADRRARWAAAHDWRNRAERLETAIRGILPKVSVIVLTHNNLDFTKACLASLTANTRYLDWELIVVDNASTDGSREFLADWVTNHPRARLVQNDENLGFAAGNNRGLQAATGDYLVILNNDTYVTPGWLLNLVRHLRKDPRLGLVGPVTNNIGNEAKIAIDYANMAEMEKAAYRYTANRARQELDVEVLAFFCTAMSRALFEEVGGLDERFGLGFFEDDDYCQRVRRAGYRITIAEDVFVHHHLSASFDALDRERRQALFERNKALYEEKWGEWRPHRYRDER